MAAAFGTFTVKLDDKSRLIVPAKARAPLADGAYLTRGEGTCLFLFSDPQFTEYRLTMDGRFEEYRAAMGERTLPHIARSRFARAFFGSVVPQSLDAQSRITVSPDLREYAGLTRDIVVVGFPERLEIWDSQLWGAYDAEAWRDYLDIYTTELPQPPKEVSSG